MTGKDNVLFNKSIERTVAMVLIDMKFSFIYIFVTIKKIFLK